MGAVKAWLMEMQEYAWDLLDDYSIDESRERFLKKYPHQDGVFDAIVDTMEGMD